MRAATCSKGANPVRMRDFARLTSYHPQVFAGHGSPGDIRRAGASPAIDAMTIARGRGPALQHVSCPAANASTSELHIISLAHFNHEFTRMNTNSCSRRAPTAVSFSFHVIFKFSAERFSGDPNFTRSRRSMSLTEVRRLD
jgi:hypothetical protein